MNKIIKISILLLWIAFWVYFDIEVWRYWQNYYEQNPVDVPVFSKGITV